MTLFSDTSTILEEVSIDYDENKVATYDDYYDDMYAIKSNKFLCFWIMKRMLYVMVIWMNLFMMLLKIIMREELMIHDALVIFQSLSFMRASLNSSCLAKRH